MGSAPQKITHQSWNGLAGRTFVDIVEMRIVGGLEIDLDAMGARCPRLGDKADVRRGSTGPREDRERVGRYEITGARKARTRAVEGQCHESIYLLVGCCAGNARMSCGALAIVGATQPLGL